MLKNTRQHLFVDRGVQGSLIARVVLYWVTCLVTITLMLLCWRVLTGPVRGFTTYFEEMKFQFGPALVASCILLPLVIVDLLRVSNRFVGPLVRLRKAMRAAARGEHVEPLSFREGDFWLELAQEFNVMLARMERSAAVSGRRDRPEAKQKDDAEAYEMAAAD
jgi:nitrogen fixation/metabolism regulation signal transduction histidine kinase